MPAVVLGLSAWLGAPILLLTFSGILFAIFMRRLYVEDVLGERLT